MFELVATSVIVSVAGIGWGIRWWLNRCALQAASDKLVVFTQALPPIAGCWLQILGEAHATLSQEGMPNANGEAYANLLKTLPAELPHWTSVGEAFERYADQPDTREGRFGKPFPAIAWDALSYVCFEREMGGPFALQHAMFNIVQKDGWNVSSQAFFGHPDSHIVFADWLSSSSDAEYRWPDGHTTTRENSLNIIIQGNQLSQNEKRNLLNQIRRTFASRYPELILSDEEKCSTEEQMISVFKTQHPYLLSEIYGKGFPEMFEKSFSLVKANAGAIAEFACAQDNIRPVIYHGYLLCPKCNQPDLLQAGVLAIVGFFGDQEYIPSVTDKRYTMLKLPLEMSALQGLEEILIGPGPDADRFLDQLLLALDHASPIPVQIHPGTQLSPATLHMVTEYSTRLHL